jgi:hypothetical protein
MTDKIRCAARGKECPSRSQKRRKRFSRTEEAAQEFMRELQARMQKRALCDLGYGLINSHSRRELNEGEVVGRELA